MTNNVVVGIDLGTTNSSVAIYIDRKLSVLENQDDGRTTPSVVFYKPNQTIVGVHAKGMAVMQPENAIHEIKRLIGRDSQDPYIQKNLKYFPFTLDTSSKDPVVCIRNYGLIMKLTPEEISAAILKKIKKDIESKWPYVVDKAVITVPAYFNVNQREKTLEAARIAGMKVPQLLNEPTAAALTYFHTNSNKTNGYYLVYDLGGGTFDVAILKRTEGNIEIVAVDGDSRLGGKDFDNLILDYVYQTLLNSYQYSPVADRRAMRRLHNFCEEAKKSLSVVEETTIVLEGFIDEMIEIPFTRKKFNAMVDHLLKKTIQIIANCLESANVAKNSIQEVILCGGSTRIVKIQEMLSKFFDGKSLNKFVNPDECVAEGAALLAAMSSSNFRQKIGNIHITEVTPLSLGIALGFDVMSFEIKRNTPIPARATTIRFTGDHEQTKMCLRVYEGERLQASKNRFLGELTIDDITPAPAGACQVMVTMRVDTNGVLTVSAKEELQKIVKDLTITYTRGIRSDHEVKNAVQDAKDCKEEDEAWVKFANRKKYLMQYCSAVIYNLERLEMTAAYKVVYVMCNEMKDILVRLDIVDKTPLEEMIENVTEKCKSLVKNCNFKNMPSGS